MTTPCYSNLLYNPLTEKLYRVAEHEKTLDKNGKINRKADLTWSILVVDKNLAVENEYLFHYHDYVPFVIAPYDDGLFISKAPNNVNSKITLSFFKL